MTEGRRFREFFRMNVEVIKVLWYLLLRDGLLPEGGAKASGLGTLFFEGVPQGEHGVFGRRRVCRHCRPKDPPQMGLGVCRRHCGMRQYYGECITP